MMIQPPNINDDAFSLLQLLRWRALQQPSDEAYTFLYENGEDLQEQSITYEALDRRARAIGAFLQESYVPGERVLLLYHPGLEYIAAFFGCLYAGIIAVPAYPPQSRRLTKRLLAIIENVDPHSALTTTQIFSQTLQRATSVANFRTLRWILTDTIDGLEDQWQHPPITRHSIAFLQYTSGSISQPKGVMLTHSNLLTNLALIDHCFQQAPSSGRWVFWLPPYHDMGLIGGILQPLFLGLPATLMAPMTFLQNPLLWLDTISRTKAAVSGGPNFAYDLCVQKIKPEQCTGLDLHSWEVAFSGAEPVRPATIERFSAAFAHCGFRREAFYPCYGLAENTLIVSGGHRTVLPVIEEFSYASLEREITSASSAIRPGNHKLVGCGRALPGQQLLIVDPETLYPCPDERIGEIWIAGPSVAQGYWNAAEETAKTFQAYLADGVGPFLRTGDLGLLCKDELFIVGRSKNVIIIRGINYYAEDLEYAIEGCHPALRSGSSAVFSIDIDGEEQIVLVHEVERHYQAHNLEEAMQTLSQILTEQYAIQPYTILLLKPGSIPRTSSGKRQRQACRQAYLEGTLYPLAQQLRNADATDSPLWPAFSLEHFLSVPQERQQLLLVSYLQEYIMRLLHLPSAQIPIQAPLHALGLDSLMMIDLQNRIEAEFSVRLQFSDFFAQATITSLAAEILRRLLHPCGIAKEFKETLATPPIKTSDYPLSYGQQSLGFLYRLQPQNGAYHIVFAAYVPTNLHKAVLQHTWQLLIERHEALRTTYHLAQEEPFQRIHSHMPFAVEEQDAGHWSIEELKSHITAAAYRPFDLEREAALRVCLFHRSPEEHVLLLAFHHIAVDFWSLVILVQELLQVYRASLSQEEIQFPALQQQYSNYVRWQQERLEGAYGERLWQYWQQQLHDAPVTFQLPTDHARPQIPTYEGKAYTFHLDQELSGHLKAFASRENTTLYTVLLAAFQVLLYRYTHQEDLLVGSPTAGRNSALFAEVIGYFVNPVVLRARFTKVLSFKDFLKQTHLTVLAALDHQEYPFPLLIQRLQPYRDQTYSPLIQVMFTLERPHRLEQMAKLVMGETDEVIELHDLRLRPFPIEQRGTQFDLSLTIIDTGTSLVGRLQYNTHLFEEATIQRITEHLNILCTQIVANADQILSRIPLLTTTEYQQIVGCWNETQQAYPRDTTLHQIFEQQVVQTPDRIALVFAEEQLTYEELNIRANQIAHYLLVLGGEREKLVGVCMQRSLEIIVALLGILKAGGAYLPLDPTYPQEHLRLMISDTGLSVLITQARQQIHLPDFLGTVLYLDTATPLLYQLSRQNPESSSGPEHLAYILYTSGSTGRPKGVMVSHRNVVRLVRNTNYARLTSDEVFLQSAPLSFDASTLEIWGALLNGARLAIFPPSLLSLEAFGELVEQYQVTLLWLTAGFFRLIVERQLRSLRSVRQLLAGGDILSVPHVKLLLQNLPECQLINGYGPTENTTFTTCYTVPHAVSFERLPIGTPIANTTIYIVDQWLQPVPIGVSGELCTGGDGVTYGYLHQPELTAEKFVPDPFSTLPGQRLYRTGDLARYLPSGEIEFLGRRDQQVKIRGFRIEPQEIEAHLLQHDGVRAAFVTTYHDTQGNKSLVAYIIPRSVSGADGLNSFLKERLPDYMIPTIFIELEAFPLTPNGKIDLRALPEPTQALSQRTQPFVAPEGALEETLAVIWQEFLGIHPIGAQDNFFELGGHSLLAMQLVARVRDIFQVELPIQELFIRPTIAAIAETIVTMKANQDTNRRPALQALSRQHYRVKRSALD